MSTKQVFVTLTAFAVIALLALSLTSGLARDVVHDRVLSEGRDDADTALAISEATARYSRFYGATHSQPATSARGAATTDATSQYAAAYGGQARKTTGASAAIAEATRRYAGFYDSAAIAVQQAATR